MLCQRRDNKKGYLGKSGSRGGKKLESCSSGHDNEGNENIDIKVEMEIEKATKWKGHSEKQKGLKRRQVDESTLTTLLI